jgi:hypothetical protein
MIWKSKTETELKDLEIEKNRIDREVELYRREKMQNVNIDIENHKIKRLKEVANLEVECHKQIAEYEHEFHSTKEIKGIELAKLEAKIEYLSENNGAYQTILANKETEIERLISVIASLTKIKK